MWTYKEFSKIYIGSAVDLSKRLKIIILLQNNNFCKALINYIYFTFSLTILEYININNLEF